jgi:hypothetical protein
MINNDTIAERLLQQAAALERNGHNLYRVRSYRRAASVVKMLPRPVSELLAEGGRPALEAIGGIGEHLSYTLEGLVRTGEFKTMGVDAGPLDPERSLTSLPGVGPRLALRMREELGITSVAEVEKAAHDGRLGKVGIGAKRLRALLAVLAARREGERGDAAATEPAVTDLLAVDEEFRTLALAQAKNLRLSSWDGIPADTGSAPVLQTRRGGWSFRATFSNTSLAHRLGLTRDWVVIRFDDGVNAGERTVVTETRNHLCGQRVVRGRERECQACWAS